MNLQPAILSFNLTPSSELLSNIALKVQHTPAVLLSYTTLDSHLGTEASSCAQITFFFAPLVACVIARLTSFVRMISKSDLSLAQWGTSKPGACCSCTFRAFRRSALGANRDQHSWNRTSDLSVAQSTYASHHVRNNKAILGVK